MGVFSSFVENTPMLFRTEFFLGKTQFNVTHSDKLLCLGSCFADCMGQRFDQLQFQVLSNPFGILYNPLSILSNLGSSLKGEKVDPSHIVQRRCTFFHYQFHSEIASKSTSELTSRLEKIQSEVKDALLTANYLFITLGTAFVYSLNEDGRTVANCHKMPSELFQKRMLPVDEVVQAFNSFLELLLSQNPAIKIVITVSPVRHTKDTLELNSVSKSVLRLICHEITRQHPTNVTYFPAFEIMMDDLRDYRFYKEDLIHPNVQAESYIWEKFSEGYFGPETMKLNKDITEIQTALNHRPFDKQSEDYIDFLKKCEEKILKIKDKIPSARLLEKLALKLSA